MLAVGCWLLVVAVAADGLTVILALVVAVAGVVVVVAVVVVCRCW